MKNRRTHQKQHGFFDLGLGLALTLIFGGTAAVVSPEHTGETSLAKQDTEIVEHVDEQLAIVELTIEE
ncbi:hypothetical protein [Kaarinaea lacus]